MDDQGAADVYRPLQFDQPEDGSMLPAAPVAENATLGSSLVPCDGGELQELIPSPAHHVVGGTMVDGVLDVEMAAVTTHARRGARESSSGRGRNGGVKRKRGRKGGRTPVKAKKSEEEEDVCFICFDGGNLVLCDRKMCPKAYHPTCVNRDEAFFRKKGRWNCGWHLCSICAKAAHFLCYTCTYSLCKGCIRQSDFLCVRANKGLCVNCMRLVMLIENKDANKENDDFRAHLVCYSLYEAFFDCSLQPSKVVVDFDDKSSWEYLFKEYWQDVKRKMSLNREEVINASNPWKGTGVTVRQIVSSNELRSANNEQNDGSDNSKGRLEKGKSTVKRQRKKPRIDAADKVLPNIIGDISGDGASELTDSERWASKELLYFVEHLKGDKSTLSVFEVQSLLMEYVTKYQLRDPDKKSQILCDARLQNLFGRARLGHFEMLKLIDSHILKKETSSEAPKIQRGNSEDDSTQVELEGSTTPKTGSDKKRKMKKKADEGTAQANLNDYAAIDAHNINLVYLRRNLVEDLLDDMEKFQEKVVGSFVRIRISGSGNKQDMYRLVQVVGISKATKEYKTGKKSTDIMLEILNLNKTEAITTDSVSNQEFSEEECKRLRQSIKCGLISRLTVGEIQEKAKALQLVKVNDWFETEILKLGHLRDRASEKGRRKELRECVEKLQVLNDPAERARRLQEVPEVHADPNMDPNYESEETEEDDRKRGTYARPRDIGYPKRGWDALSPGKGVVVDGLDGSQKSSHSPWERIKNSSASGEPIIERGQCGIGNKTLSQSKNSCSHRSEQNNDAANRAWSQGSTQLSTGMLPEITSTPQAVGVTASANNTETEKTWHYSDPSGKIQGPFSMVQLRKWSTTGYFPSDLRIWRMSEKQEDAILLSDALVGKFHQESSQSDLQGPYANAQNVGGVGRWDNSSHDSNLPGANYSTWAGSDQRDGNWKSSWKEADGFVSGSAEITRKDGQEAQSTSWTSSSMESLEPTQGHITTVSSTQDSLGGSTPWSSQSFGHSPKLPPSHVGHSYTASLQQTADTRVGVSGVKFNQPEGHMSTWSPTKPLAVQPSGTWNPSNGYDNHLSSLASATQSFGDGKKSNTENIPSKKLKEASPVANETSALGSRCNASIRTDRTDLSVSNLTQTSAGAKWLKDQTENKSVAPQSIDEPAGSVDNLRQQSSVTSQMENQISESKAADLHASVESESHLNNSEQHSSLTAIQSKDQTSESMTSDSQVLIEPVSAVDDKLSSDTAIQSVNQTSENESSVAQVSDEPLSPVNDLEQRSPTTATQPTITPTATEREQPNLVTSAMEPNSMTAGSTRIGGVWISSQSAGAMSSSSSPEPTIGVVLDADKYPKIVSAAIHPVPSAGLGPSTHGLLQPVSADGLSHVIHNDGQHCNNNMSLDLLAQELSAGSDLTAAHAETGSPDSLPEPMDTQDVLLANENSESSQFVIIAAEESTVDEIWDGLLDAEGGEPVTDFFPEDLEGDKVEGSIASTPFCSSPSQVDDSKRNLSESQISVPVEGSSQPDGWVSDSGFGSTASGCGASSTAASVPISQGSEMTSRPVVYISNEKGERSCPASDQESLQQPVDISHGNIPRDGWLSPQTSPEVSEVIQSTNPTGIPHPCPEHDEDAGASMVTTDAAGSVSVASSNTADQGVHDVSWVPDSSPLLVSAGELTPATSGSGDVPPPVQNSQASNRLPGNLCVSASEEQAPSGKDVSDMVVAASNSQVTRVFSGDFSVSTAAEQARTSSAWDAVSNKVQHPQTTGGFSVSAVATAPVASSDTWSTPISINSSNVSSLPPPVTGNTSSGVANLYLGKSSYRSAAPESWGSPSKNLIGPTDKQGVPSSHSTWRPGGVSEPSVSRRSGWGQSVDSSRGGWSQQSGNTNSRWGVDSGNQRGGWEQQRREGDRYSGYGDRGGYGGQGHGMRPWSKPLGGGGGGSGSNVSGGGPRPPRGQKICKFYENGYCKKGSSCDFLHP